MSLRKRKKPSTNYESEASDDESNSLFINKSASQNITKTNSSQKQGSSKASSSKDVSDETESRDSNRWTDSELLEMLTLYRDAADKDWEKVAKLHRNTKRTGKSCSEKYRRTKEALKAEISTYRKKASDSYKKGSSIAKNQQLELLIETNVVAIAKTTDDFASSNLLFSCHGKNYSCEDYIKVTILQNFSKFQQLDLPNDIQSEEYKRVEHLLPGTILAYKLSKIRIIRTNELFTPSTDILKLVWEIEKENTEFQISSDNLDSNVTTNVEKLVQGEMTESEKRRNRIQENVDIQRMHTVQHMTFYQNCEKWSSCLDKLMQTFDVVSSLLSNMQNEGKELTLEFRDKWKRCIVKDFATLDKIAYCLVQTFKHVPPRDIEITTKDGGLIDDQYSFEALKNESVVNISIRDRYEMDED